MLVHELGHTLFLLLFGYPAFQAFDFTYGGGISISVDRSMVLLAAVYGGIGWLAFLLRRNPRRLVAVAVLAAVYALCAHTSLHDKAIIFMGHGTELIIAGIFLYRALSGRRTWGDKLRP